MVWLNCSQFSNMYTLRGVITTLCFLLKGQKVGDHWAISGFGYLGKTLLVWAFLCHLLTVRTNLNIANKYKYIYSFILDGVIWLTLLLRGLHMSRAGWRLRKSATLSFRTLRWLLPLNHRDTTTFIQRLSFWWRWERYSLSILSSGLLALNALCFPLSFLWSIILSVVISLQGGKVVLAEHVASCSCCWFKAVHVSLIQIHDHISFMALQLWVRCFFSRCHISLNVILHACTHTLKHHVRVR